METNLLQHASLLAAPDAYWGNAVRHSGRVVWKRHVQQTYKSAKTAYDVITVPLRNPLESFYCGAVTERIIPYLANSVTYVCRPTSKCRCRPAVTRILRRRKKKSKHIKGSKVKKIRNMNDC